jgi:hypothetical protein
VSPKKQLRPTIGILTAVTHPSAKAPFGSRTAFIRQLYRAASTKANCYVFTPQNINWLTGTVHAWAYSPTAGWHRRTASLPDVVYNRLPSRSAERSEPIARLRANLSDRNIPFFNWGFFEKHDIHERLTPIPSMQTYIPETIVAPTDSEIRQLLRTHKHIYIKPVHGSLGIGIYRISYAPDDGYLVRYRTQGRVRVLHWDRLQGVMRFIHRRSGSLYNYIAQQGISLSELEGAAVDFRFHMNKSSANKWVVAGIGAKRAARGGVTTHIHSGGSLYRPEHALSRMFPAERATALLEEAKVAAVDIAETVERNYPHLLGELGLDIGIDRNGRIWLFEVNSKPGRSIFSHPALRTDGQNTMWHLINYCLYLGRKRTSRRPTR